jgi:hypothetical protein
MSIIFFNSLEFPVFRDYGQESARKMVNALNSSALSITYNQIDKRFTIENSSRVEKETIEGIFSAYSYEMWQPEILDERDPLGNRLVQFVRCPENEDSLLLINLIEMFDIPPAYVPPPLSREVNK